MAKDLTENKACQVLGPKKGPWGVVGSKAGIFSVMSDIFSGDGLRGEWTVGRQREM